MRRACARGIWLIAWLTPASLPAAAQVEEVVVSASRTATALSRTPASVSRLDLERIRALEASFLGEALNKAPGVYMNDLGNEQHAMSIRWPSTSIVTIA